MLDFLLPPTPTLKMTVTGTATRGGPADKVAMQQQCCINMCHGNQEPMFEVDGIVVKRDVQEIHLHYEHGHDMHSLGR